MALQHAAELILVGRRAPAGLLPIPEKTDVLANDSPLMFQPEYRLSTMYAGRIKVTESTSLLIGWQRVPLRVDGIMESAVNMTLGHSDQAVSEKYQNWPFNPGWKMAQQVGPSDVPTRLWHVETGRDLVNIAGGTPSCAVSYVWIQWPDKERLRQRSAEVADDTGIELFGVDAVCKTGLCQGEDEGDRQEGETSHPRRDSMANYRC
ncbi:hypothetical protein SCUP234_03045 [Seiridium cupressi]